MGCRGSGLRHLTDEEKNEVREKLDGRKEAEENLGKTLEVLAIDPEDVVRAYTLFCRIDRDKRGFVDVADILIHAGLPPSEFARRTLSAVVAEAGDDTLTFSEFFMALWGFLTLSHDQLVRHAFDMIDLGVRGRNAGRLDVGDVRQLVLMINGKDEAAAARTEEAVLGKMEKVEAAPPPPTPDQGGRNNGQTGASSFVYAPLTLSSFRRLDRAAPMLMAPAKKMQRVLAAKAPLGEAYWSRQRKTRRRWAKSKDRADLDDESAGSNTRRRRSSSSRRKSGSYYDSDDEEDGANGDDGDGGGRGEEAPDADPVALHRAMYAIPENKAIVEARQKRRDRPLRDPVYCK